jgi:hypothetical protein
MMRLVAQHGDDTLPCPGIRCYDFSSDDTLHLQTPLCICDKPSPKTQRFQSCGGPNSLSAEGVIGTVVSRTGKWIGENELKLGRNAVWREGQPGTSPWTGEGVKGCYPLLVLPLASEVGFRLWVGGRWGGLLIQSSDKLQTCIDTD